MVLAVGEVGTLVNELGKILIAVIAFRQEPNRFLARWLAGKPWRYGSLEFPTDVARNQTVNRFLLEDGGFDHLLMVDADMVPLADPLDDGRRGTEALLTESGDVLYCGFAGAEGVRGHYGDGDFGAACCRLSRRALESIAPPWFRFPTNSSGTVRTACECAQFAARIRGGPFAPRMAGVVGHLQPMVLVPGCVGKLLALAPASFAKPD